MASQNVDLEVLPAEPRRRAPKGEMADQGEEVLFPMATLAHIKNKLRRQEAFKKLKIEKKKV